VFRDSGRSEMPVEVRVEGRIGVRHREKPCYTFWPVPLFWRYGSGRTGKRAAVTLFRARGVILSRNEAVDLRDFGSTKEYEREKSAS
jgi:hypothetical protein